jgi:hypothetical protein
MISPALASLLLPLIVGISILLTFIRRCDIAEGYWMEGGWFSVRNETMREDKGNQR